MLKLSFALLVFLHGLLHLMGFVKAFRLANVAGLSRSIPKPLGLLWLAAALLFVAVAVFLLLKKENWWMTGLAAVVLSQILVFTLWQEARFGTVANVVILLACALSAGSWQFEKSFRNDVAAAMAGVSAEPAALLTENDIRHLPQPVQDYLRRTGVLHKPKLQGYKVVFDGTMREKGKDWFPFTSEQYNFTGKPARLFFMKGKLFGLTVPGYHAYKNGEAAMQIKLFGLWPLVNEKAGVLNKAETVTLFNDMCILAPATLIDPAIQWQTINPLTVKATFTVQAITISATLHFTEKGELVNFVSDDRYAIADKQQYRFSTPVSAYKNFGGYRLASHGEAVWHYPEGDFVYGKFTIKDVIYIPR